jgi:hypothetical protein
MTLGKMIRFIAWGFVGLVALTGIADLLSSSTVIHHSTCSKCVGVDRAFSFRQPSIAPSPLEQKPVVQQTLTPEPSPTAS